jgi:predicted nuclease of predicted toxin-antitoxin system
MSAAKLLFDQNLSPKLVSRLSDLYANSAHLDALGLGTTDDLTVWRYAKENGFVIVTKDADFADLSVLRGFPPRVVWIRRGNCSTSDIEEILRDNHAEIENFLNDQVSGVLTLF